MKHYLLLLLAALLLLSGCSQGRFSNKKTIDFISDYDFVHSYFTNTVVPRGYFLNMIQYTEQQERKWTDVAFTSSFLRKNKIQLQHRTALFQVDTSSYNTSHNFPFQGNPLYFDSLKSIDATNLKEQQQVIGHVK